ncbi:MAG: response regulator, partial [Actinobacteria bacterium]|nr:response regulator [Actinomycetota bacterium]
MPSSLRVLLVDDNPDDRVLVGGELSREFPGVEACAVSDAEALSDAVQAGGFDLVITDYHLPWTDGVEVLRAVKERWPDCPVVMFTGTGSEEVAVEAMKLGLDDYVLKSPQHLNGLSAAIRSALEQRDRRAVAREAADATKRTLSLLQATLDSTADGL